MSQALSETLTATQKVTCFSLSQIAVQDDTVVIGDVTYTFRDAVGTTANQVLVGTTVITSNNNLVAAINDNGVAAQYGTDTVVNPYFVAAADTTNDEVDLTPRVPGVMANGIYLAATGTAPSAAAANFGAVTGTDSLGSIRAWISAINTDGLQPNGSILAAIQEYLAISSAQA